MPVFRRIPRIINILNVIKKFPVNELITITTGSLIQTTGYYRCEKCQSEGIGGTVFLTKGDTCPSCKGHREVTWLMTRAY